MIFSAFGQTGPKRARTTYDHVIRSTSGIMAMTGDARKPSDQDRRPRDQLWTMGAFALSVALFQREFAGEGQRIDMAMLDVAMILMASHITGYMQRAAIPSLWVIVCAMRPAWPTRQGTELWCWAPLISGSSDDCGRF
jgi:crotonobetainyl-CoA:carnitine CoA-transferase CaiB-like acyl-CoA transferase